jgi:hypothetical protein
MLIVRTDKTVYKPGETVLITMTLHNQLGTSQEYLFTSAQRYDVMIKRDGEIVYRWSEDRLFAQVITKLVIAPEDSRVFKAEWNLVNNHGEKVPPGIYTIYGGIVNAAGERGSTVIELRSFR